MTKLEKELTKKLEIIERIVLNEYEGYCAPLYLSNKEIYAYICGYEGLREKLLELI